MLAVRDARRERSRRYAPSVTLTPSPSPAAFGVGEGNVARYAPSVMAPSLAVETSFTYFAIKPRV
jgi:hypothetical protein